MRFGSLKSFVSLALITTSFVTWTTPSFAMRATEPAQGGLEEKIRHALTSGKPEDLVRPITQGVSDLLSPISGNSRAGLEEGEDPLLKAWESGKDQPVFMNPLEKPILEEWEKVWPFLKKHLETKDSPIPDHLIWRVLTTSAWEERMRSLDSEQWIWLVDQTLTRWETEPSLDRLVRLRELQLLGSLDRLLLHKLISIKPRDSRTKDLKDLLQRHRKIVAGWHRQMSEDPSRLSEQFVVELLQSLEMIGKIDHVQRQWLWPDSLLRHSFDLIRQAWEEKERPSPWEASHMAQKHLPLMAALSQKSQQALFGSVLRQLLYRALKGYDSMGDLRNAHRLVELWNALSFQPASLKQTFLAALSKIPVEESLDPLLEIAADSPQVRTEVLRLLVVILHLKRWYFTDQNLPWVNLLYLMNRVRTPEQYQLLQEINRLLLRGYSGAIGVPRESLLRPLTTPVENPSSFGPDLNGFIRRQAHHVGGAHLLDLVGLRLSWWATNEKAPLVEYLERFGISEARATVQWMGDQQKAPEADELGPPIRRVLQRLAQKLHPIPETVSVEVLATVKEEILHSVEADLKQEDPNSKGLQRLFEREIPLYRLVWNLYGPKRPESSFKTIQQMHEKYRSESWWPRVEMEGFLAASQADDPYAALDALAKLQLGIYQQHLGSNDYSKWDRQSTHDFYEREFLKNQQIHHGIPAVRGYDPKDPNFQMYLLLEQMRPLAMVLRTKLLGELQAEPKGDRLARLLQGLLQWIQAAGFKSRSLQDLSELLDSPGLTLARLRLIDQQLLAYMNRTLGLLDGRMGPIVDAAASVLDEKQINPSFLDGLGGRLPRARGSWEPRLRPHLERRLLEQQEPLSSVRVIALRVGELLSQLNKEQLLEPVATDPHRIQGSPPVGWIPLSQHTIPSLVAVGEKARNLFLLNRWEHPVPPGAAYPIGQDAQQVIHGMREGVGLVEKQVAQKNLQGTLGSHFGDPDDPLLLSVRTGALLDMAGSMPTIEDVGINLGNLPALEKRIGAWAAWDAYRRFIQAFAMAVYGEKYGFNREFFDRIIESYKAQARVPKKIQLSPDQMREIALKYLDGVNGRVPGGIPSDPWEQLALSIRAAVASWDWPRVRESRELFGLTHEGGTAVILQAMVFGNFSKDDGLKRSGAGVAITQDLPGKPPVGSFGQGTQGSDVMEGVITSGSLTDLKTLMPRVERELAWRADQIREKAGEELELEFTVQDGELWLLQARVAPSRGPIQRFRHDSARKHPKILAKGYGIAGGAVQGILALPKSVEDPERLSELQQMAKDQKVQGILLVMDTAAPEDTSLLRLPGVIGFLAIRGGPGQHEGIIAGLLGLTAIAGTGQDLREGPSGEIWIGTQRLAEGSVVSADGLSGEIYLGKVPFASSTYSPSTGLEEGQIGSLPLHHEIVPDFTQRFLSGHIPSGQDSDLLNLENVPNSQLTTQWIGVVAVAEGSVGSAVGLDAVGKRQEIDKLDLRAQNVQDKIARLGHFRLFHGNFESKGLTPGALPSGAEGGDPHGIGTPTISDVVEDTKASVEGRPGASSFQLEGPGAETFGSFPDEARALMVVTHIDLTREAAVLKRYNASSIEELFDPELPVEQLAHRAAALNGVSVGHLDITILTNDSSDIEELTALQSTYSEMQFEKLSGGTFQPALAGNLGVRDGRVRLFLRRSGMTEAVFNTIFSGVFSADGAIAIFSVVSEEIKSGFDKRYVWHTRVLEQMKALRPLDWEEIRDGKTKNGKRKIFSSRQVTQPVTGAYTFLTPGRTDKRLPFHVPGIQEVGENTYQANTLVFASNPNPDQAGYGYLWLSKDTYSYTVPNHTGLEEMGVHAEDAISIILNRLLDVKDGKDVKLEKVRYWDPEKKEEVTLEVGKELAYLDSNGSATKNNPTKDKITAAVMKVAGQSETGKVVLLGAKEGLTIQIIPLNVPATPKSGLEEWQKISKDTRLESGDLLRAPNGEMYSVTAVLPDQLQRDGSKVFAWLITADGEPASTSHSTFMQGTLRKQNWEYKSSAAGLEEEKQEVVEAKAAVETARMLGQEAQRTGDQGLAQSAALDLVSAEARLEGLTRQPYGGQSYSGPMLVGQESGLEGNAVLYDQLENSGTGRREIRLFGKRSSSPFLLVPGEGVILPWDRLAQWANSNYPGTTIVNLSTADDQFLTISLPATAANSQPTTGAILNGLRLDLFHNGKNPEELSLDFRNRLETDGVIVEVVRDGVLIRPAGADLVYLAVRNLSAGLEETGLEEQGTARTSRSVSVDQIPALLQFKPNTVELGEVHIFDPENADIGRLAAAVQREPVVIIAKDAEHAEMLRRSGFDGEDRVIIRMDENGNDVLKARKKAAFLYRVLFEPRFYKAENRSEILIWLSGILERYNVPDSVLSFEKGKDLLEKLNALRGAA